MEPFETMPSDAKVWIYAANRKLSAVEQTEILARANSFVDNWKSHGQGLKAAFNILHDMFFILMVDEHFNPVGGCGTDESIHFMQGLENDYHISLFNRFQVEMMNEKTATITSKADAAKLYSESQINDSTIFFDKTLSNKKDFDNGFMIPYSKSWAFQGVKRSQPM